jgi:uncharacterized protein (DUF427 family)
MSANSGPGWKRHPDHRITTSPAGVHVRVEYKGNIIADSRSALALTEDGYPVTYYVPRADVKMDQLVPSTHETYCPFKGTASYYSIRDGPENAVRTYEHPYDEMTAIADHLAFYPDKLEIRLL